MKDIKGPLNKFKTFIYSRNIPLNYKFIYAFIIPLEINQS